MSDQKYIHQTDADKAREDVLSAAMRTPWPVERLRFFRDEVGLNEELWAGIADYAQEIVRRAPEAIEDLWDRIFKLAQIKIVLDQETTRARLTHNWKGWFETLWTWPLGDELLAAVWRSGLRHVRHDVDHRFVNLAYSHMRGFCHRTVTEIVPTEERSAAHLAVDKLFDLCLLVESDAYLSSKSQCDHEVMMGISHQMRNPLTIIGGNTSSMLRAQKGNNGLKPKLDAIFDETMRLESMVRSTSDYVALLQNDATFVDIELREMLVEMVAALSIERMKVEPGGQSAAHADRAMVTKAMEHLLRNAAEAAGEGEVHVWFEECEDCRFMRLVLENPGAPIEKDIQALFQPFHSTKPYGTGMGLPIARLAARKNFGAVNMEILEDRTRVKLTLLKPGALHSTGLFFKT